MNDSFLAALISDGIRRTSETPQRFSVYDLIAAVTGQKPKNAITTFLRLKATHHDAVGNIGMFQFPGPGQRETPVTDSTTAWLIARLVLSGSKISLEAKRELLGDVEYYPVLKFTEVELHNNVRHALAHLNIQFQYAVKDYRVDMYLPQHNIAVECDEYNHRAYSGRAESKRFETISAILQCRWIRYDPYSPDFNIFKLINQILVITLQ